MVEDQVDEGSDDQVDGGSEDQVEEAGSEIHVHVVVGMFVDDGLVLEDPVVDGVVCLVVCLVVDVDELVDDGESVWFLCIVNKLIDGLTVGLTGTSYGLISK